MHYLPGRSNVSELSDFFRQRKLCIPCIRQYGTSNSNSSILAVQYPLLPSAIPLYFSLFLSLSLCLSCAFRSFYIFLQFLWPMFHSWHKADIARHALNANWARNYFRYRVHSNLMNQPRSFRGIHPDRVAKLLGRNLINGTRFVWCYPQCHSDGVCVCVSFSLSLSLVWASLF